MDGFDEIATAGWAGKTKKLRDLRFKSMELIRAFLRDTPPAAGVLLAGRAHFFDSTREMCESLGLCGHFTTLNLSEFNEDQIKQYLAEEGWIQPIPAWIPSRPLLLGYLASKKLLQQTLEVDAGSGPAVGWNSLLKRICERESEIEAGIDPEAVRRLLGHLATIARNSPDGLGPISSDQITGAFSKVCGYPPDDRGMVLLQRLPGLGGNSLEDGSRVFIDKDFAESARATVISDFVENPYGQEIDAKNWQSSLSMLGAEVAACRLHSAAIEHGKITAALRRATDLQRCETLCADIVLTMIASRATYSGPDVFVRDAIVPELDLDGCCEGLSGIEFQECIFSRLELPAELSASCLPRFVRCYFGRVNGRTGPQDMPPEVFVDCLIESFENPAQTTKDILGLDLPLSTKVLLTLLKKLFAQRGSGRRDSALYRGLDARGRELVPKAVALLRKHGFVLRTRQSDHIVWLPTRASDYRRRALSVLAAPNTSQDPLLVESLLL